MADLVLTDVHADLGIATVTFNRPEARNAVSIALLDALDGALDDLGADNGVRVVILAGKGKSFCAGLDLEEVRSDAATIDRLITRLSQVMRRVRRLPIPTIAQVQDAAIGGGFSFLLVCDFAVTHAEARLGYPPLETSLCPAQLAPWLMTKVGPSRARSLFLAGGTISGQTGYDMGIVSHLAPRAVLGETVRDLAEELTRGGRESTAALKELLNEMDGSMDDAMLDRATRVSIDVISSDDTQERLRRLFSDR